MGNLPNNFETFNDLPDQAASREDIFSGECLEG
jgi:hypothetical protein